MTKANHKVHSGWEEQRPSRLQVAGVYFKRAIRWRRNSSPFLSGDLFADNSDVSVYPPRFRGKHYSSRDLRDARVVFCPSNHLQDFFNEFGDSLNARVILAGNSDFEFHTLPENIPNSVKQLFLQNSFISDHPLVTTLPIGIENLRWGVNGNPKFLRNKVDFDSRLNQVLIGPFGLTHSERFQIRDLAAESVDEITFVENRLYPREFSELMQEHKFVACVRGNGVDTHRLWESLYRGCVPILKADKWSLSLSLFRLPIQLVDGWSLEEIEAIIKKSSDKGFSPEKLDTLWWPYWKSLIGEYL